MRFPNSPAGCCMMIRQWPDYIELISLAVRHDLRNKGLGTKGVRALQKLGRKLGLKIRLEMVPEKGKRAALVRFYNRLGFQQVEHNVNRIPVFEWCPNSDTATVKRLNASK